MRSLLVVLTTLICVAQSTEWVLYMATAQDKVCTQIIENECMNCSWQYFQFVDCADEALRGQLRCSLQVYFGKNSQCLGLLMQIAKEFPVITSTKECVLNATTGQPCDSLYALSPILSSESSWIWILSVVGVLVLLAGAFIAAFVGFRYWRQHRTQYLEA